MVKRNANVGSTGVNVHLNCKWKCLFYKGRRLSVIVNNDIRPEKLFCILKKSSLRKQLTFRDVSTGFFVK